MAVQIESVKPFSRCWFWGVRAGDTLLSVDGKEIEDIFGLRFLYELCAGHNGVSV